MRLRLPLPGAAYAVPGLSVLSTSTEGLAAAGALAPGVSVRVGGASYELVKTGVEVQRLYAGYDKISTSYSGGRLNFLRLTATLGGLTGGAVLRNGTVRLELDGRAAVQWSGAVGRADEGRFPYFKLGIYDPSGSTAAMGVAYRRFAQRWDPEPGSQWGGPARRWPPPPPPTN